MLCGKHLCSEVSKGNHGKITLYQVVGFIASHCLLFHGWRSKCLVDAKMLIWYPSSPGQGHQSVCQFTQRTCLSGSCFAINEHKWWYVYQSAEEICSPRGIQNWWMYSREATQLPAAGLQRAFQHSPHMLNRKWYGYGSIPVDCQYQVRGKLSSYTSYFDVN